MSAYIGDRLSTAPLLKAHSIILEDNSTEDANTMATVIKESFMTGDQHGYRERIHENRIVLEALTDEAAAWASHEDAPAILRPVSINVSTAEESSQALKNAEPTSSFTPSDLATNTYLAGACEQAQASIYSRGPWASLVHATSLGRW